LNCGYSKCGWTIPAASGTALSLLASPFSPFL